MFLLHIKFKAAFTVPEGAHRDRQGYNQSFTQTLLLLCSLQSFVFQLLFMDLTL